MNRLIVLGLLFQLTFIQPLFADQSPSIPLPQDPEHEDPIAVKIPVKRSVPTPQDPEHEDPIAVKIPVKRSVPTPQDPEHEDPIAVKIPVKRSVPTPQDPEHEDPIAVKIPTRSKRGLAIHSYQWPTHLWANGIVPYDIPAHYTNAERQVILSAMDAFRGVTCIRFRPRTSSDQYYLQINKYYKLERCFSYIGRQTSRWIFGTSDGKVETRMKLDPSCLLYNGRGTVIHELMHILGFYHEHQRDDRDPRLGGAAYHYNYKIYPRQKSYYMGGYDADSIMHYNFRNVPWRSRSYFSPQDIRHINTLYNCPTMNRPNFQQSPSSSSPEIRMRNSMTSSFDKKATDTNSIFRSRRVAA